MRKEKYLIAIFAVFAAVFLATLHLRPYFLHYIVKAVPIFSLAVLVRVRINGRVGLLMMLGLVFSGIGDILLDMGLRGGFLVGVISFMIAHLFYIAAFFRGFRFSGVRSLVAVLFLVYGVVLTNRLLPNLGNMVVPIVAYACVITLMGISACSGRENHLLILLGAALFIFSDSVIIVNRVLTPIVYKSYWIMTTYYAGQLLMALGAIKSFGQVADQG